MSILVSIEDLLSGELVEGTRMEFKEGWNPAPIMRSVCAFANDFENEGSGYIIVGVEEKDGKPVRPVKGFDPDAFEQVQKEMVGYCNLILPAYVPRLSLEAIDKKHVLVIWVPAGSNRPYKVPDDVKAKHKTYNYRIRQFSSSVVPNAEQESELIQLTAKVPLDDRVNTHANIKELSFSLMREHLSKTKSKLYQESAAMSVEELAEKMNLCQGAREHLFPKNVGLLMFSENPQKFFKGAQVDVVEFPQGLGAREFSEKTFEGPIQKQLTDVLSYLKSNIIRSKVIKHPDKEESDKIYNYPYAAVEEALSNAVYHRNYELQDPIEVRVLPDSIEIISYNGVDPSLKQKDFDKGIIRARRYRNRRIGEFLKELRLTEGRGTGIPTIIRALQKNGSAKPKFDADEPERSHFITEIPVHPHFLNRGNQVSNQVGNQVGNQERSQKGFEKLAEVIANLLKEEAPTEKSIAKYVNIAKEITEEQIKVLEYALEPKKKKEILEDCLQLTNQTKNFNTHVEPLLGEKLLQRTIKDKPKSQHQKYFTTPAGKAVLYIVNEQGEK